tara:strand:- start:229 stop:501 length:273 start_codon:yes stop_codon:yes gene_type:complete
MDSWVVHPANIGQRRAKALTVATLNTRQAIKTIIKPEIEDWPDIVNVTINGVPIRIEYETQRVMIPNEAFGRQDAMAAYLIDEGFIIVGE